MPQETADTRRWNADAYAERGLSGDGYDLAQRMGLYAYAQVQASLYVGDQLARVASALEKIAR